MLLYMTFITPYGELLTLRIFEVPQPGEAFNHIYNFGKCFIIIKSRYPMIIGWGYLNWRFKQLTCCYF